MNHFAKVIIVAMFILSYFPLLSGTNYNKPKFFNSNDLSPKNINSIAVFSDDKFIIDFNKDKIDFNIVSSNQVDNKIVNNIQNFLSFKFVCIPTYKIEYNDAKLNIYSGDFVKTNIRSIKSIKYTFEDKIEMKFNYDNELKLEIELLNNYIKLENVKLFELSSNEIFDNKNSSIHLMNQNGIFSINLPEFLQINNLNGLTEVTFSGNITDKISESDILLNSIDQKIDYCTYIGGNGNDWIMSIAVDDEGSMYVAGMTTSNDLPIISGKIDSKFEGSNDIYILKIDKNKNMIWSTYWGGSSRDYVYNIKLDSKGNIWVGGDSESSNLYTTNNAYQKYLKGGADGLIGKLNKDGEILYATFLGGNDYDSFTIFDIDKNDNIWLSGRTISSNFPLTKDAYQKNATGDLDSFLAKMTNDGKLLYSSYLGSSGADVMEGFYVTDSFEVFQSGFTNSSNFPIINTISPKYKGQFDTFIVKYDSTGQPVWSRLYGGSNNDMSRNLIADSKGNIYVTGYTNSNDLPNTQGNFQSKNNGMWDVYISKFDNDGNTLKSTYFGGSASEGTSATNAQWGGICIDNNDKIYLSGFTESKDLWTSENTIYTENQGMADQFILKFDEELNPEWATYFGGKSNDYGKDIFLKNNILYSVGWTESNNLPITSDSYQEKFHTSIDGYILEINNNCKNFFSLNSLKDFGTLSFVGNSFIKNNKIVLTNSMNYQRGAVWQKIQFNVNKSFETTFSFRMINPKTASSNIDLPLPGADGIAFVIQNSSHEAIGGFGAEIGYNGIPNSIAVEYDMFYNDNTSKYNDPNGNHVAIMSNGKYANTSEHNSISTLAINSDVVLMNPYGTIYYSKIKYDGDSKLFSVYLDSTNKFSTLILSKNIDISKLLELSKGEFAWIGFTSATNYDFMSHEILSWDICADSTYDIIADVDFNEFNEDEYSIYPNPTTSTIKIDNIQLSNNSQIIMTDIIGRDIEITDKLKIESNSLIIDLSAYINGTYYLTITENQAIKTYKLIKF